MTKKEFLFYLRKKLRHFPPSEIESALDYYEEVINEKMLREHLSETQAVSSLGKPADVAKLCASEMLMESKQKNPGKAAMIMLGALASPILLPIGIVAFVVLTVIFAVWVSLVFSFGAASLGGIAFAIGGCVSQIGFVPGFTAVGIGLIIFTTFAFLCTITAYYGGRLITNFISHIAKSITRRHDKGAAL